jgi:hypothetical protein
VNTIHPWTTGYASVYNSIGSPYVITPQAQGYDTDLGGVDITVTRVNLHQVWDKTASVLTTETNTYKSYLYGVTRVVSMVRPRLIHTYTTPIDPSESIWMSRPIARMATLKVFFVPEPTGLLLLGAGVAALLGLSRMRRR